jgi:hypothetical protein
MGAMSTLYLLCFFVGTLALVVSLARRQAGEGRVVSAPPAKPDDEVTVPGARIEPSDEYSVEGGAGGAEGEGGSLGYHDGADGGVGGAEGGADGTTVRHEASWVAALVSGSGAGLGAAGYLLSTGGASPWSTFGLALLSGAILGLAAAAVARSTGPRARD